MDTQSTQTPGTPESGNPGAVSATGTAQPASTQYGIGAFNAIGVDHSRVAGKATAQVAAGQVATTQTVTPPQGQSNAGQEQATRQLTEKDERHFEKFVSRASQEKFDLAKIAIETDENAIYKIAETDKDLAQRLLKEYDYGTDDVDVLLEKKNISNSKNPEEAERELMTTKRIQTMEKQLLEEKILRLKGEDPELQGEVEAKFREIVGKKEFAEYDDQQQIAIAKTLMGKKQTQSSADNVALAVLQREEGIASSPRGASATPNQRVVSPEMKKMMQSANITEKDLAVLPPNIDELIQSMYGPLVG